MLSKEETGLVLVDVQGQLAKLVDNSSEFILQCEKLIKGAITLDLPIIWLEQNPNKLGCTTKCLSDLLSDYSSITKFTFDACQAPEFMQQIKTVNKKSWLICGIEAHICVYQTAMHLRDLHYDVHLVSDAISSRTLVNKTLAINKLAHSGVSITGVEMCLYELVKDCRAPEFKDILTLIK